MARLGRKSSCARARRADARRAAALQRCPPSSHSHAPPHTKQVQRAVRGALRREHGQGPHVRHGLCHDALAHGQIQCVAWRRRGVWRMRFCVCVRAHRPAAAAARAIKHASLPPPPPKKHKQRRATSSCCSFTTSRATTAAGATAPCASTRRRAPRRSTAAPAPARRPTTRARPPKMPCE